MRVALITNFCPHYRYKLFQLLSERQGFDIFFFEDIKKTREDIGHLKFVSDERFLYLPMRKILFRLLKNRFDVIIKCTNKKWTFLTSFILSKLIGSKFIIWHSVWYYPKILQYKFFSPFFMCLLKNFTDAIVVYGEHGKSFLLKRGINPDKIFVAWQTVNNELYGRKVTGEEEKKIRVELGIKSENIILYVGRFERSKGIEYLMAALKLLKDKGIQFAFLCIGGGNLRGYIGRWTKENNINSIFPGIVSPEELPSYYKIATLLILPSITTKTFKEPWGLVVNEAFNQGCPVVVTDSVGAGVGGLVKDGINGFVVPERDPSSLASATEKIILDKALRENLSKNAKEEISKWTYERQAKGFFDAVEYSFRRKSSSV